MRRRQLIEARRVSSTFDDRPVLAEVTLHVAPRECVGLIGSGVGGSVLLRIMGGWVKPRSGAVYLRGGDRPADQQRLRRVTSYAAVDCVLGDGLRVDEYLGFIAQTRPQRDPGTTIVEATSRVGLDPAAAIAALNPTQRGVVAMTAALLCASDVVLVEDVFHALAAPQRQSLLAWLSRVRDAGAGVVIATEDAAGVDGLCTRVVTLDASGPTRNVEHERIVMEKR
jgi:ABC-type multidrug transport system ATPase subunit